MAMMNYDERFVTEQVDLILSGNSINKVSQRTGVARQTLRRWTESKIGRPLNQPRQKQKTQRRCCDPLLCKSTPPPAGWTIKGDGEYYKASGDRVFRHDGFEWVLSTRTVKSIRRESDKVEFNQ